ncbi:uncharacterized protein LAESUDRAFT_662905 [Laetiporus sulphureus 93-53]|uniref:Uncharacterized protein n=1 Tax=Laetiporus sulphureus 93-53 TaxID=1314785 RepID=A0A165BYY4_9APHY|nr:uncharacterized protein LAESUDRAFT_662905 [Laetiporus sulphureus 93-53]KZT01904.1 hypothetical protein LAESUDRAFT_662905 [Laetiporus sulphureus 93-53]
MLSCGLLCLALASASLALPATLTARTSSSCSGLGGGAFDTAHNFTLAAYNLGASNANATGAPLVLGPNGESDGQEYKVLSTYASYPYDVDSYPSFSLNAGVLKPNPSNASMSSTDVSVAEGSMPKFVVSSSSLSDSAPIYCAVASIDPDGGSDYPELAVNGEIDAFSLCMNGAQKNVVYKATSENSCAYNHDSCYPVRVQLVGLD